LGAGWLVSASSWLLCGLRTRLRQHIDDDKGDSHCDDDLWRHNNTVDAKQ